MTFEVFHPNYIDEYWICKNAIDHEDAAKKYAERADRLGGDYELAKGGCYMITVRSCEDGTIKKFLMNASQSVEYHAQEIYYDEKLI